MKTYAQRFLTIIKALVGCSIYVWGGNGEDLAKMTDTQRMAYYRKHETECSAETIEKNIARDEALFQKMKANGCPVIRAFDCSGLVYYVLKQLFPNQKDKAARTFYAECNPSTDKTGMKISDLRSGDFVFKYNGKKITHIGVFLGEKMQIIDATGRDLGVTERSLTSDFNRFGRWPALQAEDPTPEPEPTPTPEPEPAPVPVTTYVRVNPGKSVRVRSGPSTGYRTIKIAHGGDRFLLLDYVGTGWYPVKVNDTENGYITNKVQYTHLYDVEG